MSARICRRRVLGAIVVALSVSIALAGSSCAPPDPRADAALLAAASGLDGRLAGVSGPVDDGDADLRPVRRRVLAHLARTAGRPGPSEEAVAGLLALHARQPERAVALLASASERSAEWRDANDLAVALVESSARNGSPIDLVRALDALGRAEAASPGRPEVAFNLALVTSSLHLRRVATRAWEAVRGSTDEVSARLAGGSPSRHRRWRSASAALETDETLDPERYAALLESFPQFIREYSHLQLVGRWSEAVVAGDRQGAERAVAQGELIGRLAAARWDDASIARLYTYLRGGCGPSPVAACARAHRDFAAGVEAFDRGRTGVAEQLLPSSVAALRDLGSPVLPWAEYFLAYATFHRGIESSSRWLDRMLAEASASGDPLLLGRLHWRRGVAADSSRDPSRALRLIDRGTELICAEPGDLDCAFGDILASEAYELSGDLRKSWEVRLRALDDVVALGTPRQVHSALSVVSQALVRQGYPFAAEPFVRELVLHAEESGNPELFTGALRDEGQSLAAAGRLAEARTRFAAARSAAGGIGPGHRQRNLLCTIDLVEGAAAVDDEPRRAVLLLNRALDSVECSGNEFFRLLALSHRAAAHRVLGDARRSESDLVTVLELYEEQRQGALDGSRYLSLVAAQPVFDELLQLLLGSGRAAEALSVAERSRNRFLLEARLRTGEAVEPSSGPQIARMLPQGTLLVQYAELEDDLVAWVVSRGEVRAFVLPLDRGALRRSVAELRHDLTHGASEEDASPQATELFRLLVSPLDLELDRFHRVVFVPDRSLFGVPFAALRDPRTGRPLIEDVAVATSPSSSLLFVPPPPRSGRRPPLIVAAPDLEGTAAASLPALSGAFEEARVLAEMFPGAVTLSAGRATRSAFLRAAPSASFIHFAGHALAEQDSPFRSRLPFAREADGPSELDAGQIAALRIDAPLVVLSACSTLEGFAADRENLLGLAGAFFAAGSGAVVATLGPAEDGATIELMKGLHRGYAAGAAPSIALRDSIASHRLREGPAGRLGDWANLVVLESLAGELGAADSNPAPKATRGRERPRHRESER